jgi:hypothetical protein
MVACPDSREHQHESLTSAFYKSLKHTYEHFSGGISFEDGETIRARQVGRIARCWLKKEPVTFDFSAERISSGSLHEWSGRTFVTVDGVLPGMIQNLRATRGMTHASIQEAFAYWQQQKGKTFKEFYEFEKASYTQGLIRGYIGDCKKRQRMAVQIARGEMPPLNDVLPSAIENQMLSLQYQFQAGVGEQWAAAMRNFFASGAVNEAPFVIISAAMFASLAMKAASGQKKIPNQGTVTDVNIVSTLLPYCDAMFMDNECSALLHDIPRSHALPHRCRVFSLNTGADFIRYLTEIRDSVSPEHLRLVEQVYGPDPLRPPESIYGLDERRSSSS